MSGPKLVVRTASSQIDLRAWARALAKEVVRLDREGALPRPDDMARPARKAVP